MDSKDLQVTTPGNSICNVGPDYSLFGFHVPQLLWKIREPIQERVYRLKRFLACTLCHSFQVHFHRSFGFTKSFYKPLLPSSQTTRYGNQLKSLFLSLLKCSRSNSTSLIIQLLDQIYIFVITTRDLGALAVSTVKDQCMGRLFHPGTPLHFIYLKREKRSSI